MAAACLRHWSRQPLGRGIALIAQEDTASLGVCPEPLRRFTYSAERSEGSFALNAGATVASGERAARPFSRLRVEARREGRLTEKREELGTAS